MSSKLYVISARVNGQTAYLQATGVGGLQFFMRKDQLTRHRLRAKGGEVVCFEEATRFNDVAVERQRNVVLTHMVYDMDISNVEVVEAMY